MKRIIVFCLFLFSLLTINAQQSFYSEKIQEFSKMRPVDSTDVVMLGDEFTEYAGDWNILLRWHHIRNRGIAGDNVQGVYARLSQVMRGKPKMIFLMIGVNDLINNVSPSELLNDYALLVKKIQRDSPKTRIYVQSVLPINEGYNRDDLKGKTNTVASFNKMLRHWCEYNHVAYINLFKSFVRHGTNELRRELTQDGFALSPFGYKVWAFELKKYIISDEHN